MHSVTVEQEFGVPPQRAWEVLVDLESYPSIIDSYARVELQPGGMSGVGAQWRQTRTVFGREHSQVMEVAAWEPPSLLVLVAEEGGAAYESRYELSAAGDGCRVRLTFSARPTGILAGLFMRLLGGKMVASTGAAMGKDLAQLADAAGGAQMQ